jgi:hypothetical protein
MNLPGFIANNLIFIFPAYATTFLLFFGVLLVKISANHAGWLKPLLAPIDRNSSLMGRRLIGDHKIAAGWIMPMIAAALGSLLFGNFAMLVIISYFCFFGDLAGSILKRRFGMEEHEPLLVFDQLSFFFGGYAAAYLMGFRMPLAELALWALITFAIHFSGNLILSRLKLKATPY